MNKQEYIDTAEQELLHTYNRFSLVLDHGEGVYLYDTDKKAYLDFAAGIAVCALGYSNEAYKNALKDQVDKLLHTSNLYYNVPTIEAAKKALKASGMDRIFFTNSGTEAIEGAIKAAKKYAYTRDGHAGHEICNTACFKRILHRRGKHHRKHPKGFSCPYRNIRSGYHTDC